MQAHNGRISVSLETCDLQKTLSIMHTRDQTFRDKNRNKRRKFN